MENILQKHPRTDMCCLGQWVNKRKHLGLRENKEDIGQTSFRGKLLKLPNWLTGPSIRQFRKKKKNYLFEFC